MLKFPSRVSTRKSLRFSPRASLVPAEEDVAVIEEIDVDERVTRARCDQLGKAGTPVSVGVDNSKVFQVLQEGFPPETAEELAWPDFTLLSPQEAVEFLGETMKCRNHEENLATFWILDTLCEILRQGQIGGLSSDSLRATTLWFAYLLKTISVYAPTREDFFIDLNRMLLEAEAQYLECGVMPRPQGILETLHARSKLSNHELVGGQTSLADTRQAVSSNVTASSDGSSWGDEEARSCSAQAGEETSSGGTPDDQCDNINEIKFLTQQLFAVFGNRFKYELIRSVFSDPPEIQPIVIVDDMNFPKELTVSQRQIKEMNERKRAKKARASADLMKAGKGKNKGKPEKEVASQAVERFRSQLQDLDWERGDLELKTKTQDLFVKPLEDAVDRQFFDRLFAKSDLGAVSPRPSLREKSMDKGKKKKK